MLFKDLRSMIYGRRFKILLVIFLLITLYLASYILRPARAEDELDDIAKQISELEKARSMSVNATKPLESELNKLDQKITNILAGIKRAEDNLVLLDKSIVQREKDFNIQYTILAQRVESYYKRLRQPSGLFLLLSSQTVSTLTKDLSYRQAVADEDKKIIAKISSDLLQLENDKKRSETEKQTLAVLKAKTDNEAAFFRKEVKGAKEYQAKLSSQIAQLSAKQQEIIAQKLGSLNISRSAYSMGRCDSDLTNGRDPGFSPKFALFTYGVPNRVGLNQFGAKGRADAGQNEEEILRAYYNNFELKKDYSQDITINVQGNSSYKIEDYLKHIFEIPSDWNMAALKAQAIAARSYALAYTNNGQGSICATEQCQVFHAEEKGGRWNEAVDATKGWVMVQGGNPIKAWFSSTHGGYVFSSGEIGWSGTPWTKHATDVKASVNSFSDLQNNAYDKESPWFYCDWGSRPEYNKTAWLKSDEIADIANVILLTRKDSSLKPHFYQTDKPNPEGQETWNKEKVKQELGSAAFSSVSDISISADFSAGKTTNVTISGDGKSESFSGSEFKDWFNLRAPSNINIVGPLFNIEKK